MISPALGLIERKRELYCVKCGSKQRARARRAYSFGRCHHCGANPVGFVKIRAQNLRRGAITGFGVVGRIYGVRIIDSSVYV